MLSDPLDAARELLQRKKAPDNLLAFTEYTHPRWVTSEHNTRLCAYLEALERIVECPFCGQVMDSLVINAPPRHGKTELVSRRFPAWCMGRHPEWNMICAQATGQLAADTGADVREIVKAPEFKRLFPKLQLRQDAQAAQRWINQMGGVYYAAGTDGTIVGRGANLLDLDDLHGGRNEAESQRMRDLVFSWYFGDALQRVEPPYRQLLTFTRWHQDDLIGRLVGTWRDWQETPDPQFFCARDWHVLRLRAIEHEDTPQAKALWPERFPLDYLYNLRDKMRRAGRGRDWEAQYQQNPTPEEGSFLKREWFERRYEGDPPRGSRIYLLTDFAVSSRETSRDPDRTELVTIAHTPEDDVWILDCETIVDTTDVWIEKLIDKVQLYKPFVVFGEKGIIKNSIEPILERRLRDRRAAANFQWMPQMADKMARGRALQAWASSRRIVFPAKADWSIETFIDEIVAVGGGGRYDDKFDALAHFFLAIDDNNAAVLQVEPSPAKKRDSWTEVKQKGRHWR